MQYSFLRPEIKSVNISSFAQSESRGRNHKSAMKKLSTPSRIIIAVVSLCIVAAYFLPVWRIDLFAPQYPEGLVLKIWLNNLSGDVDIINGLNHYIGMKKINVGMFPEFSFLIYLVAAFILYGLVIAITGSRKILFSYLVVSAIGGLLAMYDFYQWGYDYGHNLNPEAPIKIPGMGYQPPLIGHKKLLNFDAYSMPDVAGYIVIGVVFIAAVIWFLEYRKK
jgi:copper chaperone NosL